MVSRNVSFYVENSCAAQNVCIYFIYIFFINVFIFNIIFNKSFKRNILHINLCTFTFDKFNASLNDSV